MASWRWVQVVAVVVLFCAAQTFQSPLEPDKRDKRQVHATHSPAHTTASTLNDPMSKWLQRLTSHKANVLFLIGDDLRPKLGCYGDSNMITPNIDHLASMSVRFDRAYAQQAVCGPSRTSFLTGRRPDTTRVFNLDDYWRTVAGNFSTLPQYFKEHGYASHGIGKIFHPGTSAGHADDSPYSWTDKYDRAQATLNTGSKDAAAIHPVDETGGKLQDTVIADNAIAWMKNHAQHGNQPFFLAVGFHKPHLPWVFPKQYLSLYPLSHIHLAKYRTKPSNIPDYAWSDFGELRGYQDVASLHLTAPEYHIADNEQLKLRQAYSASVSYMDAQLGRVLDALHHNGFTQNTIIVFLGDHGWHLGDSGEWCKHTNFEVAVRIPMMIYVPGVTAGGHHFKFIDALDTSTTTQPLYLGSWHSTDELVEAVDLFPTVTELAGLPVPQTCPVNSLHVPVCTEGTSLVPLLRAVRSRAHGTNYSVEWKDAAYSQYPRGGHGHRVMGYTIRTDQFRYTEWVEYDHQHYRANFNSVHGRELYDHTTDPEEFHNLANDAAHQSTRSHLSQKLRSGWRSTLHTYVGNLH